MVMMVISLFMIYNGNVLVHPQKRYLEGQNMWDLCDSNGVYVIQSLVNEGMKPTGGYTEYVREKTSLAREVGKLSFSTSLNNWDWMVGTGSYVDDVEALVSDLEQEIDNNTKIMTLITIAMRLTMLHSRFANHKLKKYLMR